MKKIKSKACAKPCKECPFRKDSLEGYLGDASNDPQLFLGTISYKAIPCHLSVNWDEKPVDFSGSTPCTGSLQYMNNTFKLSKDYETMQLQKQVGKNPKVFETSAEFINHHS